MQSGDSLTWNVDLAAGTSITLKITDSTGATQYNQAVTIRMSHNRLEYDLIPRRGWV
jgi:hypothetical protein